MRLHWERSDAFEHASDVVLDFEDGSRKTFPIRAVRPVDRAVLLSLRGIEDRDAADALRGASVSVSREALPPLGSGEYYLCDLVGATVVCPEGIVGEVIDVRIHPSVDTLVVRTPDGDLLEQPLSDPWIRTVDAEGRRVELSGRGGLISS